MSAQLDDVTTIALDEDEDYAHILTVEPIGDDEIMLQDIVSEDGRPLSLHSVVLTYEQADVLQRDLQRRLGRLRA